MYLPPNITLKVQVLSLCVCAVLLLIPKADALDLGNVEMQDVKIKSSTASGAIQSFMDIMVKQGIKQAQTKAEAGDAKAQNTLGEAYQEGQGVPKNIKKSAKWFKLAADQGNASAQYHLSLMYQSGIGVTHDADKALQLLHKAAEQDHAKAQYKLAKHFGQGKNRNLSKKLKWMEMSANNGDPQAMNDLGSMYLLGAYVSKDQSVAFSLFHKAAKAGFLEAMENLSMCYRYGLGVDIDTELATLWLTKAAEKGSPGAQYKLGVSQGYNISWITKSAQQGFPHAQRLLGMMYISGKGTEQHASRGFYWLVRAQGSGNAEAEKTLNKAAQSIREHWLSELKAVQSIREQRLSEQKK